MKERFIQALSRVIWDTDLVATRVTLSFAEFLWAVMLLVPDEGVFTRPTYANMAHLMNQDQWGMILLISAVTQFTIVLQNDFHSRFARYFAAWNAVLWVYIGTVSPLLSVSPPPAAMGGEMALGIAAGWIWLRPFLLRNAYKRGYQDAGLL